MHFCNVVVDVEPVVLGAAAGRGGAAGPVGAFRPVGVGAAGPLERGSLDRARKGEGENRKE